MVLKQCKLQDRQNKNGKKTRAEPMLDGNMTVHTDGRNLTARDLRTCSLWDTFLNDYLPPISELRRNFNKN